MAGKRAAVRTCRWRRIGLIAVLSVLLAAGSVVVAAPAVAATAFSLEAAPTPDEPYGGHYDAVTCPSTTECWATVAPSSVQGATGAPNVLAHWTGGAWSLVTVPSLVDGFARAIGITCVSESDCWAVSTRVEHWDGTAWTVVPAPAGVYHAVSCSSASRCWAVGTVPTAPGSTYLPQFIRWNGSRWRTVDSGVGAVPAAFAAIDCPAANLCWAVGYRKRGQPFYAAYDQWNGSRWTFEPTTAWETTFTGVSCVGRNFCQTVGYGTDITQPWVSTWDGTSWTAPQELSFGENAGGQLNAVSCLNKLACWAVGNKGFSDGREQPLLERWNGTSWKQAAIGVPTGEATLYGVACLRSSTGPGSLCKAVGGTLVDDPKYEDVIVETRPT